jgi:hypothetical protein
MSKIKTGLLLLVLALLLAACSQVEEVPRGELESTATSDIYSSYSWYEGKPQQYLSSIPYEKVCWLSGLGGNFSSSSEHVDLWNYHGSWNFSGSSSGNKGLRANVYCVKLSAFKTPNLSQPARMMSDPGFLNYSQAKQCSFQKPTYTWWGDAATFITSVGGELRGDSNITVKQSTNGYQSSSLSTCANGNVSGVSGEAHSLFIGKPQSGDVPQFWGPGGVAVPYSPGIQHQLYSRGGYYVTEMAPVDKAFCYFDYIAGTFDETSDRVRIYQGYNSADQKVWKLSVNTSNSEVVAASALCYMLTQY